MGRERVTRLRRWSEREGIRGGVFDLDGTFLDVHQTFLVEKENFFKFVLERMPHLSEASLREVYEGVNKNAHSVHHVSPQRWNWVTKELGRRFGGGGVFEEGLYIFQRIYEQKPVVLEGAVETAELMKLAGLKVGIVTHRNEDYLNRHKRDVPELFDFVDAVHVADEHSVKDYYDWQKGVALLGLGVSEVIMAGDSLQYDIYEAWNAGIRLRVKVPDTFVVNQMRLPPGTLEARGIYEVPEAVMDPLWRYKFALMKLMARNDILGYGKRVKRSG